MSSREAAAHIQVDDLQSKTVPYFQCKSFSYLLVGYANKLVHAVLSIHTYLATVKSALTIFSPSPVHLEVMEAELMLKNVALQELAMHLPNIVLPVPGGLNRHINNVNK